MNKRLEDYILIDPDLIEETGAQALLFGLGLSTYEYLSGYDISSIEAWLGISSLFVGLTLYKFTNPFLISYYISKERKY